MKCLHTGIVDLIAKHVTEIGGAGGTVDILPVAYAVAKALGQVIASAEGDGQRARLLFMTATTLKAEIAVSDEHDRAAAATPEQPARAGSVH